MILISTLGGLIALVGWGLSDYFAGKSGQQSNAILTTLVLQLMGVILLLPVVLWRGLPLDLNANILIIIASAGFFTIAHVSFVKAMAIGPFGIAAPIGNSYPLITLLVATSVFHLQLSLPRLLALSTIVAGVILLVVDRTTIDHRTFRGTTIFLAVVTMVSWGFGFAIIDTVVTEFAWYQLLFLLSSFVALFSFLFYIASDRALPRWQLLRYSNMQHAWRAGFLGVVGAIAFFAASEHSGSVVIPAVIASASPLATSILAYVRDRERLPFYKRCGAIVVLIGLVLLNIW